MLKLLFCRVAARGRLVALLLALAVLLLMSPIQVARAAIIAAPTNSLGMVGFWSFDEGTSTTIVDQSGNGNNGVVMSASGYPIWVPGKFDYGMEFASTTLGGVVVPPSSSLNNLGPMSIAVWIKGTPDGNYPDIVVKSDGAGNGWSLTGGNSNYISFQVDDNDYAVWSGPLDGNWHQMVITWAGGSYPDTEGTLKIYEDGVLKSTTANFGQTSGAVTDATTYMQIGCGNWNYWFAGGPDQCASDGFNGQVDNLRIYNRVLTAQEVAGLYKSDQAALTIAMNQGSSDALGDGSTLKNGLVGHWTFDGAEMIENVTDTSGQGNNGDLEGFTSTSSAVVPGIEGQALSFNGSTQEVSLPISSSLNLTGAWTLSAWIKMTQPPSSGATAYSILSSFVSGYADEYAMGVFSINNAYFMYGGNYNYGWQPSQGTPVSMKVGQWYLWTMTNDDVHMRFYLNAVNLYTDAGGSYGGVQDGEYIGSYIGQSSFFLGDMDDVRIYSRALSASEVEQLYNLGTVTVNASSAQLNDGSSLSSGLIGYWTFDGPEMIKNVTDSSINGNNGDLVGYTSTSSALVPGIEGQALSFNGVNQYVSAPSSASLNTPINSPYTWTVSGWVEFPTIPANNTYCFMADYSNSNSSALYNLYTIPVYFGNSLIKGGNGNGGIQDTLSGSADMIAGKWYYIAETYNGTTDTIYLNGSVGASGSFTPRTNSTARTLGIGAAAGGGDLCQESLDDVRIYSRALSASEVEQLYDLGR